MTPSHFFQSLARIRPGTSSIAQVVAALGTPTVSEASAGALLLAFPAHGVDVFVDRGDRGAPDRVLAVLIPVATGTGLAFFHNYTRRVTHRTYHVVCTDCAASVRRDRVAGFALRFVGLFTGLCGLGLTLAGACWWFIANAHDRAMIQTWIGIPLAMLVLGSVIPGVGSKVGVPAAIRPMRQRPFTLTSFKRQVGVATAT